MCTYFHVLFGGEIFRISFSDVEEKTNLMKHIREFGDYALHLYLRLNLFGYYTQSEFFKRLNIDLFEFIKKKGWNAKKIIAIEVFRDIFLL